MQQIYSVKGMHCQSCVRKIEQGMASFAKTVRVSLSEAQLYLTDPFISFDELKTRLAGIGAYELMPQKKTPSAFAAIQPYFPLLLIVAYLTVVSCISVSSVSDWMRHFMAGFFLVFSFFKILNIRAFADGYAKYDLLAMRWKPYGFVYPFCELGLGLAYLFNWQMRGVLLATLVLTLFGACGVVQSMCRKEEIRCACLGNLLNVPHRPMNSGDNEGLRMQLAGLKQSNTPLKLSYDGTAKPSDRLEASGIQRKPLSDLHR